MQAECEGVPMNPDYQHLHNELWARQTAAIERASSGALAAAAEAEMQPPGRCQSLWTLQRGYAPAVGNLWHCMIEDPRAPAM